MVLLQELSTLSQKSLPTQFISLSRPILTVKSDYFSS